MFDSHKSHMLNQLINCPTSQETDGYLTAYDFAVNEKFLFRLWAYIFFYLETFEKSNYSISVIPTLAALNFLDLIYVHVFISLESYSNITENITTSMSFSNR